MEDFDIGFTGFETVDQADIGTPSITIGQDLSKPVKNGLIKAGKIYNTVTGESFDNAVIVPVVAIKNFVEWVPVDAGGGFVAIHKPDSDLVLSLTGGRKVFGSIQTPNGVMKLVGKREQHFPTELVETVDLYCLLIQENGMPTPVVLRVWSTKFKFYSKLMGMAQSRVYKTASGEIRQSPLFAYAYRIGTEAQQTKQGSIHGYTVEFAGPTAEESRVSRDIFNMAVGLFKAVTAGEVVAVSPERDMGDIVAEDVGGFTHDTQAHEAHAEKF